MRSTWHRVPDKLLNDKLLNHSIGSLAVSCWCCLGMRQQVPNSSCLVQLCLLAFVPPATGCHNLIRACQPQTSFIRERLSSMLSNSDNLLGL